MSFYVAVGISHGDTSITGGYLDMEQQKTSYIQVSLSKYVDSGIEYYVSMKAKNGAGFFSNVMVSSPVIVLGENIPGVIDDGRNKFIDEDATRDTSSLAITFRGFQSEICNIISYEFAIGSEPFFSDVSSFSDFGIVHNETHGWAERHITLDEDKTYYATMRARTGHDCHEEFIVSSSDGITVDSMAPTVSIIPTLNDTTVEENFYVYNDDNFGISLNVDDSSGNVHVTYSIGHLPFADDVWPSTVSEDYRIKPGTISLPTGESVFVSINATDAIGNKWTGTFGQYTLDISKPRVSNFSCSEMISAKLPFVNCTWSVSELESTLKTQVISVGSTAMADDIVPEANISSSTSSWIFDLHDLIKGAIFVTLKMINVVNSEDSFTFEVKVDSSDPVIEAIEIVTWIYPDQERNNKLCQIPLSYVDIRLSGVSDAESGIKR